MRQLIPVDTPSCVDGDMSTEACLWRPPPQNVRADMIRQCSVFCQFAPLVGPRLFHIVALVLVALVKLFATAVTLTWCEIVMQARMDALDKSRRFVDFKWHSWDS